MSGMVGNQDDRFSRVAAHMVQARKSLMTASSLRLDKPLMRCILTGLFIVIDHSSYNLNILVV